MKKVILATVFALTLGISAFAGAKKVDKRGLRAFQKEFVGATDVQWHSFDEYIRVDFTLNNVPLVACYSSDGVRLALLRNILFSSLPLALQFDIGKKYKDHWVSQLYE